MDNFTFSDIDSVFIRSSHNSLTSLQEEAEISWDTEIEMEDGILRIPYSFLKESDICPDVYLVFSFNGEKTKFSEKELMISVRSSEEGSFTQIDIKWKNIKAWRRFKKALEDLYPENRNNQIVWSKLQ